MGFLSSIVGRFATPSKYQGKADLVKIGPKLQSEIPSRLGPQGEELATEYLTGQGYEILERNYRTKPGEIDIIAKDGETLCFVEVKTRRTLDFGAGSDAIETFKKRKLCQAALLYVTRHHLTEAEARFDVVSILLREGGRYEVELIKNAFEMNEGLF